MSIILIGIVFAVVQTTVIIPNKKQNEAMELLDSSNYEAAYEFLDDLGNSDMIASSKYERAMALIDLGDYETAYILLKDLDYKDSADKRKLIEESDKWVRICPIGDTFFFGSYEQDNIISNGKEDIEWIVLAKEGNNVLAISFYALDCQQYNTSYERVTWQTCSLRKWLNDTFVSTAFNSKEQNSIISTADTAVRIPSNSTSTGDNVTDKVFILSNTEVNKYFGKEKSARQCQGTAYCYAQGACETNNYIWWWMRTTGRSSALQAPCINNDGSIDFEGSHVDVDNDAVRPALWISLE